MHLSRILILLSLLCSSNAAAQWLVDNAIPTGRLIVTYKADETSNAGLGALQGNRKSTDSLHRSHWRAQQGLTFSRGLSGRTELLDAGTAEQRALQQMALQLSHDPNVDKISVDYKRFPLVVPNDPLYQNNLSEPGNQSYLYEGDFSLRAPGAWDITTGSQSAVIAIVDTGVLPEHPELEARSIAGLGYDFVSADQPGDYTSANDGDGRDANPLDPGDYCQSNPSSWHGTGVASVAAGNSNNGTGIAGIDWNARLLHARALGKCGGTDADIIDAIRWSAGLAVSGLPLNETPATVVNLSIGGPTECTPAWQNVIDELNELGIPFVIAAGNERTNALRSSPANCADVITVGSNTPGGDLDSGFSNYGLKVTIAAPGRNILMATNTGIQEVDSEGYDYQRETGSSFSAALVSGAISLMQSLNPNLSPAAIRSILQQSASEFSTDEDCGTYYCGAGILNLTRAMQFARDGGYNADLNTEDTVLTTQSSDMQLDTPVSGSLFGYRDIRYYKITTTETGLLTVTSDAEADLFGYLLDDQYSVLARDDDSHTALNFRLASRVPAGDYFVAVERSANRISDGESAYQLTASLSLDQPDAFSFAAVYNAPISAAITSETIRISGLTESAVVSVSGGYYSVNNGEFTADQGLVSNGDSLLVSLQSAAAAATESGLTLTVGAFATDFKVTTTDGFSAPSGETSGESTRSGCVLSQSQGRFDPTLTLLLLLATAATGVKHRQRRRH
jgi:serine protease